MAAAASAAWAVPLPTAPAETHLGAAGGAPLRAAVGDSCRILAAKPRRARRYSLRVRPNGNCDARVNAGQSQRGFSVQPVRGLSGRRDRGPQVPEAWFGGSDSEKKVEEEEKEEPEEEREYKKKYSKLAVSLGVDAIGFLVDKSFLDFDFGWAPVAAFVVQRMYRAPLLTAVGFVEEAIPGVNYLPTATLGWVVESYPQLQWVTKLPFMGQIGKMTKKKTPWWLPF